ncbi:hypothetical protein J2045_003360 [Peteryoungia aggregata LMG 23059]|uniref:Uncharacterized protein n=1 Tax=Peteryoungia aggregata LMG 23059 TaxID=1368425 RepID=A0ABU0GAC4_9HYPH|nr:hypothetical protein [Peteryoungia aggregata]MDQ0422312.1 hypothetical protein [Peteryoungia aggregata LMG 23059]
MYLDDPREHSTPLDRQVQAMAVKSGSGDRFITARMVAVQASPAAAVPILAITKVGLPDPD